MLGYKLIHVSKSIAEVSIWQTDEGLMALYFTDIYYVA